MGAWTTTLIQTITRATNGPISFTSIPSGYTDLYLVGQIRSTVAAFTDYLTVFYNSDTTGSNYHCSHNIINGGVQGSDNDSVNGRVTPAGRCMLGDSATSGERTVVEFWIPNYLSSTLGKISRYKLFSLASATHVGAIFAGIHNWKSAAAITQIDFGNSSSDNFVAGSWVSLYGQKEV